MTDKVQLGFTGRVLRNSWTKDGVELDISATTVNKIHIKDGSGTVTEKTATLNDDEGSNVQEYVLQAADIPDSAANATTWEYQFEIAIPDYTGRGSIKRFEGVRSLA